MVATAVLTTGIIGLTKGFSSAQASTIPVATTALRGYGIQFKTNLNKVATPRIPQAQAMSEVKQMMDHAPLDAIFGYITLNQNSNIRIPMVDAAGRLNNGIVTNYPVWLVRITGLHLLPDAPSLPSNASSEARLAYARKINAEAQNAEYGFVDATNGQVLFVVTLNQPSS